MGIVIDMSKYKTCRDLSLSILGCSTKKSDKEYSTNYLYQMASQAKQIIYYTKSSAWKTSCAFNISQALKTGHFILKRPEPGLIRLVATESPLFYIDIYLRKSFYTSDKIQPMIEKLVDETIGRKSWICPILLESIGRDPVLFANRGIDWEKVRMKKIDEDLPPRFS